MRGRLERVRPRKLERRFCRTRGSERLTKRVTARWRGFPNRSFPAISGRRSPRFFLPRSLVHKAVVLPGEPSCSDWHPVRSAHGHPVGVAAGRDEVRLGHELLAAAAGLARRRCVGSAASGSPEAPSRSPRDRLEPSEPGQRLRPGEKGALPLARTRRTGASRARSATSSPMPAARRSASS